MAARSKAWVCGRSGEIMGLNPTGAWMPVCCECCMLSGRGLCDEVITRPEGSYGLWCVVVYDIESSWMRRPCPTGGCYAKKKETFAQRITQGKAHLLSYISYSSDIDCRTYSLFTTVSIIQIVWCRMIHESCMMNLKGCGRNP